MKHIQTILNSILSKNVFEYLLIDRSFRIAYTSEGIDSFLGVFPAKEEDVINYFPEFIGYEEEILHVFDTPGKSIKIATVLKKQNYFNIYIDHYDSNEALILMHNITDITLERQKTLQYGNEALLITETLQKIVDQQNMLLFVADRDHQIAFANRQILEILNLQEGESKNLCQALIKKINGEIQNCHDLESYISKNHHISIGNEIYRVEIKPIDSIHKLYMFTVVTEMYTRQKNLESEVKFDPLTRCYRKKYFDLFLQERFKKREPFALVVVDIDDFKKVNDTYGHIVGDEILKRFATLLKSRIRKEDILARWGGEEFIFLLHAESPKETIQRVEKIRETIACYKFPAIDRLTASFGIAWVDFEHDTPQTLISRADQALYEAKRQGKNRVVFKERD